jgi:acyl transferase domain-containing protein
VGGANLILAPGATAAMTEKGVLSPEGSCKTFSADADGYARGEAITAVYIKPLDAAVRDGNPIRAVIRSTMSNNDGKTPGISHPSTESQEAVIRKAYHVAGITDFSKTAFVECHGTGTAVGDPTEANAVARVFGDSGVFIGSVKPNLGHSEGASGITSLIKAVLTLEHRIIPPNIKFSSPNPEIPFRDSKLFVPLEPTPWPESRYERVSVNSFGMGGSNAHVILDSARSFNVPTPVSQLVVSPQLLLFSANSAASLQKMTHSFQDWVINELDKLEYLAYTLANRREHLPHRAFMIARRDRPGVASQGRRTANPSPNLVMVFTGQGAQWPRMGRELLLRSDLRFQSSIRSLDKYLRDAPGAPEWMLEEELLKPAKTSGVQAAELSQPLCTAVQIALVDLFAAIGVEPSAVVGHSSGEIAAAYAAGALTAREAIIVAWQRGRAAKKQTRPGAMAAVGLGWDEVNSFLAPSVVVACENSPKSVTLSGDASEVQAAISRIKQSHPEAMARLLKVDKAYHSYHMREIGDEYCSVLRKDLVGKPPLKPFFSSVTGEQEEGLLDAAYWQRNLESPVLFMTAISGILDQVKNVAFLEIGPHPALAGPVRQILAQAPSSAPYVSAMARGEDCVESFLTAIGKLFELNISVDFNALLPTGSCLPDLPRYPWDHEADYWRESRISHEWRCREYPSHPLLGIRQLESTSLEPSWRNMLYVDKVSWLRDHKIEENIVFPCAAYISMVGEGVRQISGSQNAFTLRHMVLSVALVLAEGAPTELVTTFHPHRLTDSLDSQWWDFTIASHNGHLWTKHCTGRVTSEAGEPPQAQDATSLPRKLERRKYYDILNRAGMRFGPHFQRFVDIRTSTVQHLATAKVSSYRSGDEEHYHLHPTTIDACIQLAPCAAVKGLVEAKYCRAVPTKIKRVTIHRCASNIEMRVSGSATVQQCIANGNIVLHMEGLNLSPLEEAEATETGSLHTTARLTWGPHIDFLDAANLIRPSIPRHLYASSLDELARLSLVYSHRRIKGAQTALPHMQKYQAWIDRQVQAIGIGENSSITVLDDVVIMGKVGSLVHQMSDTPVAACAAAIQKVVTNVSALFSGQTDALDILLADDTLTKLYIATDACDRSQFIRHLAHSKPNLRILEIGAGTGASTASMLKHLALPGPIRQPLYSKYTFTDISSAFFISAKDHFKRHHNIEYRILDISKDPMEQGFNGEKYDLIIATNVIHATKCLGDSLKNVHKLLDSNGRLLLHELYSTSKWPNFIFGTLPGWWYGELDGRPDEPCVEPARWESELTRAGFASLDAVVLDGQEPYQLNSIMVAKPQANSTQANKKTVTLLCDNGESHADSLSRLLQSRGYVVHSCRLGEELPGSQDVVSLLDCSRPFFEDISESRYKAFQHLLDNLGGSGILWITHPCQVQCHDPRYAQIIGAARTIRTEMLLDFATCEVDDISSSLDSIVDVFTKFQAREEDESLKPDYEYAIVNNAVNVGRFYPFSLKNELLAETSPEDRVALDMAKPGRLASLQWIPRGVRPLNGDEIEVQIYAAGLNFKVRCLTLPQA